MALALKFEATVLEFLSNAKPKELGESLVGAEMVPVDSVIVLVLPGPAAGPLPVIYAGVVLLSLEETRTLTPLGLLVLIVTSCFWMFTSSSAVLFIVDSRVVLLVEIERLWFVIAETSLEIKVPDINKTEKLNNISKSTFPRIKIALGLGAAKRERERGFFFPFSTCRKLKHSNIVA